MKWFRNKFRKEFSNSSVNNTFYSSLRDLPPELFNVVESNSNELVIIWNSNCEIIFVSQSVKRLLGYTKDEFSTMKFNEIINYPHIKLVRDNVQHLTNTTTYQTNLQLIQKDQSYSWFDSVFHKLSNKDNATHFVAFLESIDSQKELEEVIVKSEKMSVAGQLAAGVVHEIRNPLTSIKGFVQLMEAGMGGKQEYYDIMIEEIEKMEAMASELLYISRPTNQEMELESLSEMIEDCLILLSTQARQKNIVLDKDIKYNQLIYCNRSQIKQVLINLIKNAIEAIEDEGQVFVRVHKEGEFVAIDVVDDGPGVPVELIEELDQPFFTTKKHGTGLGLMVSQQIIQEHGGELIIKRNIKRGSTFRFLIPIKANNNR